MAQVTKDPSQINDSSSSPQGEAETKPAPLPKWNCRVEGQPKDQQWTVGEVFHLDCEGPSVEFLSTELQFKHKEEQTYALRILEVEKQSENSLSLQVTAYNAGNLQLDESSIMDQKVPMLKVEPITLQVKSVIQDPAQKPFGPILAMKLAYPNWLWIALGGAVLILAFFSIFRWRRKRQMLKVIEELKQHNTALGAFNQFNKDVRTLGRQYIFGKKEDWSETKRKQYVENLDEAFRMYLLREFYIPALDWNTNLVVRTISKQDKKEAKIYSDDLRKFLKEIDRAKSDTEKLKMHDCKQLTQMAKA